MADEPIIESKSKKDMATAIGIPMAFVGLIIGYLLDHGVLMALINLPAFFFVIVGSIGVTMASVRLSLFMQMPKLSLLAFNPPALPSSKDLIGTIAELADKVRRSGSLAVQSDVKEIDNRFLQQGMNLVVNGVEGDQIRAAMEIESYSMAQRHSTGANMFAMAAGFCPTLGILGTVMGLISVLGALSDPSSLGPKIATAFIATLYGVGFANIFFGPVANKLKAITRDELAQREIIMEGVLMINANMTPRQIKERLSAYLPPEPAEKKEKIEEDPFAPEEE